MKKLITLILVVFIAFFAISCDNSTPNPDPIANAPEVNTVEKINAMSDSQKQELITFVAQSSQANGEEYNEMSIQIKQKMISTPNVEQTITNADGTLTIKGLYDSVNSEMIFKAFYNGHKGGNFTIWGSENIVSSSYAAELNTSYVVRVDSDIELLEAGDVFSYCTNIESTQDKYSAHFYLNDREITISL